MLIEDRALTVTALPVPLFVAVRAALDRLVPEA